jgi:hypothetical protein
LALQTENSFLRTEKTFKHTHDRVDLRITGIFGGNYHWYFRLEILVVWSAGNITGMVGGNYYWYLRAEILIRRVAFVVVLTFLGLSCTNIQINVKNCIYINV